jgi:hypothetical protein
MSVDATTRKTADRMHSPGIIFVMLFALGLICSFVAGSKKLSWTHVIGFTAVTAITFYVILDMEYPRLGFIRIDECDQVM